MPKSVKVLPGQLEVVCREVCVVCGKDGPSKRKGSRVRWFSWWCMCEPGEAAADRVWFTTRPDYLEPVGAARPAGHWHGQYVCVHHRQRTWDFVARSMTPDQLRESTLR